MEWTKMSRAQRERLINAVFYIAQNTSDLVAKKLFKLLYLVDVSHFQATGQPFSGLTYHAAKPAPIPEDLAFELESLKPDLAAKIRAEHIVVAGKQRHLIRPMADATFSDDRIAPAQMQMLVDVVKTFGSLDFESIDVGVADNGAYAGALATPGNARRIEFANVISDSDPYREHKLNAASEYMRRDKFLRAVA